MASAAAEALSRRLGAVVWGLSGAWYGRHMAAAERAIRTRLPLVDLVLEVRDARIPASSAFGPLSRRTLEPNARRVVVLNKADLADPSETKKWVAYLKQKSCSCVAVDSHNRESVQEGKLKHAIVTSRPGETRDISGYKVASHPNIYVLDTPGALSSRFANDDSGSRLALTGAIKDSLLEEYDIAQFLLALVNSHEEYRKWENSNQVGDNVSFGITGTSKGHDKYQYVSDNTQDFVVKAVRQILFESISSFKMDPGKEDEIRSLIDCQIVSLQEAFKVSTESSEDKLKSVAFKLLNLYRTGRLGRYTLDHIPDDGQEVTA